MELLIHYCWKHRLFPLKELQTTDGQPVEVIDPGLHNRHAGPDFFNAKVKINGNLGLWTGRHKIYPEEFDTWKEAIDRCIGRDIEDFEIYQSGKYTIYIDAHHHDGTNRFKLTCYC